MDMITSFVAILAGFLLRLAIPIVLTVLLIIILRKLDSRWQVEANHQALSIQKPECWKIKGCTPEQIQNCPASKSSLPCWQVYRLPNGYLNDECLSCSVFIEAPVPALKIETRSL